MQDYVEHRDGGYYIAGTRIGLDSVVHAFNNGAAAESILRSFPHIGSLERVYGAITFYLANQGTVDEYMRQQDALWEELERVQTPLPASLRDKLERARKTVSR